MKKETKCVHSGTYHDKETGGINSPIFTSSSFEYLDQVENLYPRYFNTPNQNTVVRKLCALEEAEDGVLFSSGMAGISTSILAFACIGDHMIMLDELYGGSHAFATNQFKRLGIEYTFTATDVASIRKSIRENTKVVMIESPTNPLLNVIDIRKVAKLGKEYGIVTIIDNTFATPINQNPINMGIDIVVHSGTKYLGGHSDICCGIALADKEKTKRIRAMALNLGGSLNATTCYLLERSLKTLAIRVQRQTKNAFALAEFLDNHPFINRVYYPGLPNSVGHEIAKSQMEGFGAMLSFEINEGKIDANHFLRRLKLISPAVSLGGIDTTICSPAVTSHAKISKAERDKIGITDSLLRLSVGIEHVEDLISDLKYALD